MPTHYQGTPEEIRALNTYIKLTRAANAVLARTFAHLKDYNLTGSQFGVLEALYHLGSLAQRELSDKLLVSPGNVTMVINNLEKRGLVVRKANPKDKRVSTVCLTDSGEALIADIFPKHVRGITDDMRVLTTDEQDALAGLCKRLGLQLP